MKEQTSAEIQRLLELYQRFHGSEWRIGRSTRRAIYNGLGDHDMIGAMDNSDLAELVILAVRFTGMCLDNAMERLGSMSEEDAEVVHRVLNTDERPGAPA